MTHPNLWEPRALSLNLLAGPLREDAILAEAGIVAIEDCIRLLLGARTERCRIAALLVAKAHRLSIGIYSMAIDCVGQEAGALVRPLQEIYELLEYLRRDRSRAQLLIDGKQPKAGAVAKAIGGRLQELREYLNDHASHASFTVEALGHLLDTESGDVRISRDPGHGTVLQRNLVSLLALINLVLTEALLILDEEKPGSADALFAEHEARSAAAKQRAISLNLVQAPSDFD